MARTAEAGGPLYCVQKTKAKKSGEKESTLEQGSEVTEFIRSVGSEPATCLWVSVTVPVHVFSLSSGRAPFASEFMSKLSHCVGPLILIQVFLSSCRSCDCLQTCFRPSQGNLSGLDSHQREASQEDGLSHSLFVLPASFSALLLSIFSCYVNIMSLLIQYFTSSEVYSRTSLCVVCLSRSISPKDECAPVS